MKNQHIKKYFVDWSEGNLAEKRKEQVENHLGNCRECREYYTKMETILTNPDASALPQLQPDYFLPTKISEWEKQNGSNHFRGASKKIRHQLTFGTVIVFFALVTGIFMGKWISETAAVSETEVVLSYSSMLSDDGIDQVWDNIATETIGEEQ